MNRFTERLAAGPVLGAEGYLFELERRGYLQSGPYVPEVVLDYPDAVRELHREFLRCGADVMVAFTYYGHRAKLRQIGREGDLERLNRDALAIARDVAREGDALLAGNICNTWVYDPAEPATSGAEVRAMYEEQVSWAVQAGADLIIAETNDYLGEALIAAEVIREAGLPSVVTFAAFEHARTTDDVPIVEACRRLEASGADVVGLNCTRGPQTMLPLLREIRETVSCPIAAQPVPYRTTAEQPTFQSLRLPDGARAFPIGLDGHTSTRFEMADFAREAEALGVGYIGVCCGGAPHHVRAMAEALGRRPPAAHYSPRLDLHPVLGEGISDKEQARARDFRDT
jgi:betaine-homocysteine S-methyltransferase